MSGWSTITEIEDIMSAGGVAASTDDGQDNAIADPVVVANAIERGDSILGQYLNQKYDLTTITGTPATNVWVKWASATFAAIEIMRRKGGIVPPGLQELYEQYLVILKTVTGGSGTIPNLYPRASPGIAVSNLTIDNRYNRAKIRKSESISWPVGLSKLPVFTDVRDTGSGTAYGP
jgi:hypothetical protein